MIQFAQDTIGTGYNWHKKQLVQDTIALTDVCFVVASAMLFGFSTAQNIKRFLKILHILLIIVLLLVMLLIMEEQNITKCQQRTKHS